MQQFDSPDAQYAALGAYPSQGISPEQMAEYEKRNKIDKLVNNARGSLERIAHALDVARREDASPLLKSDLQNASRHAVHMAKQIRLIKESLFPVAEKPAKADSVVNGVDVVATQ